MLELDTRFFELFVFSRTSLAILLSSQGLALRDILLAFSRLALNPNKSFFRYHSGDARITSLVDGPSIITNLFLLPFFLKINLAGSQARSHTHTQDSNSTTGRCSFIGVACENPSFDGRGALLLMVLISSQLSD